MVRYMYKLMYRLSTQAVRFPKGLTFYWRLERVGRPRLHDSTGTIHITLSVHSGPCFQWYQSSPAWSNTFRIAPMALAFPTEQVYSSADVIATAVSTPSDLPALSHCLLILSPLGICCLQFALLHLRLGRISYPWSMHCFTSEVGLGTA